MVADAPPEVIVTAVAPAARAQPAAIYGPVDSAPSPRPEECPDSASDEIVVCQVVDPQQYRVEAELPPPPTAMEEVAQAVRKLKVGPFEVVAGGPDGSVGFGLRLRF